jgi:hypothetical protein
MRSSNPFLTRGAVTPSLGSPTKGGSSRPSPADDVSVSAIREGLSRMDVMDRAGSARDYAPLPELRRADTKDYTGRNVSSSDE